MKRVSIVTPWLDCPEFIGAYVNAVSLADEVIIVDTGSTNENRQAYADALNTIGHAKYLNYGNRGGNYGHWCNAGMKFATGDIIICLNNDVSGAPQWIDVVRQDVEGKVVCGPAVNAQRIAGIDVPYVEGWCVAATREAWEEVGGWDTEIFPGAGYWEDNDLSFRFSLQGYILKKTNWPIYHLHGGNNTSKLHPEFYRDSEKNKQAFARRVQEALEMLA